MTEKKTSDAQIKATRKWEEKNRKKTTIQSYRRTARSFIRNHATEEDLKELEQLIQDRRDQLRAD